MRELLFVASGLADTDRLGTALAESLPARSTVALSGTLGSGKTRLVQAIAAACGVPRDTVVSPTFVLCQEYHGTQSVYHLDVYRLKDREEFLQLGPEEYFDSPGLTLIEWADRIAECLPAERLEIHIDVLGESSRRFRLIARGESFETALSRIAAMICIDPPPRHGGHGEDQDDEKVDRKEGNE